MTDVCYCTREDVKLALDASETARANARIDRQVRATSRMIDGVMRRAFYPTLATRYFDWPNTSYAPPWVLWLPSGRDEIASLVTLVAGGITIDPADIFLEPNDLGPPYNRVALSLGTPAAFGTTTTWQRSIAITALFGYTADEDAGPTLAAAVSSTTATTITVSDGSVAGVGSLLRIDNERMNVTGRSSATSGQTITADLAALASVTAVPVSSGAAFAIGETVLVDSEYMLVQDITGNTLLVKRAWDGSALAAHTSGATVYALRLLTVERGVLGTTAATHSNGAQAYIHRVPAGIKSLCVAQALASLLGDASSWASPVRRGPRSQPGDPFATDLDRLWEMARDTYQRRRVAQAV